MGREINHKPRVNTQLEWIQSQKITNNEALVSEMQDTLLAVDLLRLTDLLVVCQPACSLAGTLLASNF